ncbi:histidinol dehydrogenase, partial [Candidatus Dojkabacteria bacterium]|nr:histidinol dehydrogenase [Candidatus Dojkabacteria bacterium]
DQTASPEYCAADILARAEHAPDAAGVLVTDSEDLAEKTKKSIERQVKSLSRKEIILKSLKMYSCIVLLDSIEEAVDFTNDYAPEHLEVITKDPFADLEKIQNAGSIFLGEYAPVAVGDYASGTNHILPTGFWTKFSSAVGVETFQKRSEVQYLTKQGLKNLSGIVKEISRVEKLDAHWNSLSIRLKK